MPRRPSDQHRPVPLSFADLSRRRSCARSTVTRAAAKGGPIHAAVTSPGRVDAAHASVRRWLAAAGAQRDEELPLDVRFVSRELFVALAEDMPPRALTTPDGQVDLSSGKVLEFLAARPFRRGPYDASEVQADWLDVPGEWYSITRREPDGSHRNRGCLQSAYLARLIGAVPTAADVKAFERAHTDFEFEFDDRLRRPADLAEVRGQ